MTDFKAKMHQIRFRLELRPRPRWGSLQRSPRPPNWIWGRFAAGGKGWAGKEEEREGEVEGNEREGPKLLLNQGPLGSLATPLTHIIQLVLAIILDVDN